MSIHSGDICKQSQKLLKIVLDVFTLPNFVGGALVKLVSTLSLQL